MWIETTPFLEDDTMKHPLSLAALTCLSLFVGTAHAEIKTESVSYTVDGVEHIGHLAYDDSIEGKQPAVIVVHEWWGIGAHAKKSAEDLAELGYVGFAIDMYGGAALTDKVPEAAKQSGEVKSNPELAKTRFEAALELLQAHERVNAKAIGAIGYCFGGAIVLEMARAGLPLAGVVSFHGSLGSAWPDAPKKIDALILVLNGAIDPFVSEEEIAAFMGEMKAAKADWQLIQYGGAVHSFTNPEVDKYKISGAAYDGIAARRSWDHMKLFFQEAFK